MLIKCKGKLLNCASPMVMGILNVTPDSFFDGGKWHDEQSIIAQADKILADGAAIIDIGGMSTRPGAAVVDENEEIKRVLPAIKNILNKHPHAIISVDTIRASVAKASIEAGAAIINDISGGTFDIAMIDTVAKLQVPYIIMHKQGMPADMQANPVYENVIKEVFDFLRIQLVKCKAAGIADVIVDVGFGFGKTLEHNFKLLAHLNVFTMLDCPILVGVSRKSMINKTLHIQPDQALNGTTALNMAALLKGGNILRVHDVKQAVEVVTLYNSLNATIE